MKGGVNTSYFAALSFPDSKKVPIYCLVDRESSSRRIVKPNLELMIFRRLSAPKPSRSNHSTKAPLLWFSKDNSTGHSERKIKKK